MTQAQMTIEAQRFSHQLARGMITLNEACDFLADLHMSRCLHGLADVCQCILDEWATHHGLGRIHGASMPTPCCPACGYRF